MNFFGIGSVTWILLTGALLSFSAQNHSERLANENRRPLQKENSALRGIDITIVYPNGEGMCQATAVAKKELEDQPGTCRAGLLGAAHCFPRRDFSAIIFDGIGSIPKRNLRLLIPDEYYAGAPTPGSADERRPRPGDSATIIFDAPCEKLEQFTPVELAPSKDGITQINTDSVFLQKRAGETVGNRGGGAQIQAHRVDGESDMFRFSVPSPQGYAIEGGDSGGPVFNELGQLVCSISGSSYEYKKAHGLLSSPSDGNPETVLDPFKVDCDKRAIARLRIDLEKFGLKPSGEGSSVPQLAQIPRTSVRPPSLASSSQNPQDPCLDKLTQEAKAQRSSLSLRMQDQAQATQARTFLDLVAKAESQTDFSQSDNESRLAKFLEVLSEGNPAQETQSLWYNEGGMWMPQNFQNLVTTIQRYQKAKGKSDQHHILEEAVDHLGWLTTNYRFPVRGSGFSDNRYLYDHARKWLDCVKNPPVRPDPFEDVQFDPGDPIITTSDGP